MEKFFAFVVYGGGKTNGVDQTSGKNIVIGAGPSVGAFP